MQIDAALQRQILATANIDLEFGKIDLKFLFNMLANGRIGFIQAGRIRQIPEP